MAREVKFGPWLTDGFELYKQNFGTLVLASLLVLILSSVTMGILAGPMTGGLMLLVLKLKRGEEPKPTVGNLFDGFSYFGQTFLFVLVWGLIAAVAFVVLNLLPCLGQVAFIAGALALGTFLMFALFLIVDRNMEFWPASMTSMAAVKEAFWPLLGFSVVAQILGQIGAVACGIGVIFTMPIAYCALTAAYEDYMSGVSGAPEPAVEPQPAEPTPPTDPQPPTS